jgi:hypothetical protein
MTDLGIDLRKLNYTFTKKPLLVGGKAMEYYGLRKSGDDIDFIAYEDDVKNLITRYPDRVKDLWADLGVCPFEFEIWRSILLFKYEDLLEGAVETDHYLIISKTNLLIMKALAMNNKKYLKDTHLLVQSMLNDLYKKFASERSAVDHILSCQDKIEFIEKTGPESG